METHHEGRDETRQAVKKTKFKDVVLEKLSCGVDKNTEKTEIYSLWDQLEKMIQTRAPSNWETYLSVIKKRAAGMPLVEIAATEEKSLPRITAICAITKVYIREVEETFQQENPQSNTQILSMQQQKQINFQNKIPQTQNQQLRKISSKFPPRFKPEED